MCAPASGRFRLWCSAFCLLRLAWHRAKKDFNSAPFVVRLDKLNFWVHLPSYQTGFPSLVHIVNMLIE
jgi:hypothetical protein